MQIKSSFITNSSSTCFVGWGVLLGRKYLHVTNSLDTESLKEEFPTLMIYHDRGSGKTAVMHKEHFDYFGEYYATSIDPAIASPLSPGERSEIERFIEALNIKEDVALDFFTYVSDG